MRSFNFFSLPPDLIRSLLLQWLSVQGPEVILIYGGPSEEQVGRVISGSGPSLNYDENGSPFYTNADGHPLDPSLDLKALETAPALGFGSAPDIKAYHLILNHDETGKVVYSIGFCKRLESGALSYETKMLIDDDKKKSPLLRYVLENHDVQNPKYSRLFSYNPESDQQRLNSNDELLLKYMAIEIKAAGGLTRDPLKNRVRLNRMSQEAFDWMNGCRKEGWQFMPLNRQLFNNAVKEALLGRLLHHIAFGEESEAMKLIKMDPSLLLSGLRAPVTLCAPEMHCPLIPAFELVAFLGDWFFAREIIGAINHSEKLSESEKIGYKADLLNQLEEVENHGIKMLFDNLLNKGVQILDADTLENNPIERQRYEADVTERNAYHLIIQTHQENEKRQVISCVLGYRYQNPKTGVYEYRQFEIPANHELFQTKALELYEGLKNANNGHGIHHTHYFTRSHCHLDLVREILQKEGVETRCLENMKKQDFRSLLNYFEIGIHAKGWSNDRYREQWYGEICAELRLFSALQWQYWLSDENPWSLNEAEVDRFICRPSRPAGDKNYYNHPIFPLSSFLGDRFIACAGRACGWRGASRGLLKSILKIEGQEWKKLKTFLQAGVNLTSSKTLAL